MQLLFRGDFICMSVCWGPSCWIHIQSRYLYILQYYYCRNFLPTENDYSTVYPMTVNLHKGPSPTVRKAKLRLWRKYILRAEGGISCALPWKCSPLTQIRREQKNDWSSSTCLLYGPSRQQRGGRRLRHRFRNPQRGGHNAVQSVTVLRWSLSSSPARWPASFAFDQSLFCWRPHLTIPCSLSLLSVLLHLTLSSISFVLPYLFCSLFCLICSMHSCLHAVLFAAFCTRSSTRCSASLARWTTFPVPYPAYTAQFSASTACCHPHLLAFLPQATNCTDMWADLPHLLIKLQLFSLCYSPSSLSCSLPCLFCFLYSLSCSLSYLACSFSAFHACWSASYVIWPASPAHYAAAVESLLLAVQPFLLTALPLLLSVQPVLLAVLPHSSFAAYHASWSASYVSWPASTALYAATGESLLVDIQPFLLTALPLMIRNICFEASIRKTFSEFHIQANIC